VSTGAHLTPTKRQLLSGILEERTDDKGLFDELVGGPVHVHLEMMDDGCLWMAFSNSHHSDETITVWVRAEKGRKLSVRLYEDE
jgi:hypothetical protein